MCLFKVHVQNGSMTYEVENNTTSMLQLATMVAVGLLLGIHKFLSMYAVAL